MARLSGTGSAKLTFRQKLLHLNWEFVLLIVLTASIGFAMLYSAANGDFDPWASRQLMRFAVGILLMLAVAMTDIRVWLRAAFPIYAVCLALLAAVELMGSIGMGAQRWLDLGFFQLQPSEVMKVAVVLALARYFHGLESEDAGRLTNLAIPLLLVAAPMALVLRQPDLGTAGVVAMVGAAMFWLGGARLWQFATVAAAAAAAIPVGWQFLHTYQKQRIFTFLNPETDPLGSGYHILQSKIALGSGGLFGKGFLAGTQSHLNFLPEKQTDFIFTMLAEEFGLVGGTGLIALYGLLIAYGIYIAFRARSHFARLLAMGLTVNFFLYVFINIAMVMGILPVVGVPLPLISYGGTAMLTVLIGFGLIMSCWLHRDTYINKRGGAA
ncbi:MAG: rod shape-determining protein RodA, partial [Rhodospirillaceae bacterium]|jgi:rod shape determining protein RodA|nr:rod shape-determining protein RodA [Rhodospirillaceae bacterium]MBT5943857.1 rod shape-determining protein RodA [Rhodospirillaceae bacterium]MBT6403431.1 rod shape-determining protein RodA [Rhodospirillaceae bacterium]MBT6536674.1 rod shape-determining protein RodA [Rhodospirillaceae bacterium]